MTEGANADPSMSLALTGDSILTRRVSVNGDEPSRKLKRLIENADVAFTNLEVLPNDFRGHPAARSDGAHLAAGSWVVDELLGMGFDLFSLANNHTLDYGVDGLLRTLEVLEDRGVRYAGAGRNLAEARMPVYLERNGGTVATLACSSTFFAEQAAGERRPDVQGRPGVNPLRFEAVYELPPEQLEALRSIAGALGLERKRKEFVGLGFAFEPKDPAVLPFVDTNLRAAGLLNANFRAAERPAVRTEPHERDLEGITRWVREARARADVVVVSVHAHEEGETMEEPAEFVRAFARRVIAEGADVVVGHGPHLLRGMEVHCGKPIFYSLGNLIGQNELVERLPADSYERFGVDPALTPSEVFRKRNQDGRKGFPADERYWETLVPVCYFEGGKLSLVEIFPVALTRGRLPHHRGRPYLAEGERAQEILSRFVVLSDRFGTEIDVRDGKWATARLGKRDGAD